MKLSDNIKEKLEKNNIYDNSDNELVYIDSKILVNFLFDKNINCNKKLEIINIFASLNQVDDIIMEDVIVPFLINNKCSHNTIFLKFLYQNYKILEKINIKKYFPNILKDEKISSKIFFNAFDNNFIEIDVIIEHILYKNLPLYINKKNKLCTIENGIETSTKTKVNKKEVLNTIEILKKNIP